MPQPLPTQFDSRIDEHLPPPRWQSLTSGAGIEVKNIEALIDDGGDITVGPIAPIECAANAADRHNALAMLFRRKDEALKALLERLDKAIARFNETGEPTDELHASRGAAAVCSSAVPRPQEGRR